MDLKTVWNDVKRYALSIGVVVLLVLTFLCVSHYRTAAKAAMANALSTPVPQTQQANQAEATAVTAKAVAEAHAADTSKQLSHIAAEPSVADGGPSQQAQDLARLLGD